VDRLRAITHTQRRVAGLALVAGALIIFPYLYNWPPFDAVLDPFRTFQATRLAIWLIVLLGLNLLTGYSGQISLGHGAFVAIGAYTAAVLMDHYGVPLVLAVMAAGLLTGAFGFLLGIPAVRLTGPYLAIATLAMMLALPQILKLNHIRDLTGGVSGILLTTPRAPAAVDAFMTDRQWLYYSCMVPAALLTFMAWNITHSRVGRALMALRETEIGAQQMGVNVSLYRRTAFALSAFYAGIGGALFVFTEAFMSPDTFDVNLSITMLVMIVLGGLASIIGTVLGALVMTLRLDIVDELTRIGLLKLPGFLVPGENQSPDTLRGALYGTTLILTVVFMPRGIAGFLQDLREHRFHVPRPHVPPFASRARTIAAVDEPPAAGPPGPARR
jgi:branched-chain amino acid transport system permease protein